MMRRLYLLGIVFSFLATGAQAAKIDPKIVNFPWKNAADAEARYRLADHPNKVHVLEFLSISCGFCVKNAPVVQAMAAEYADNERVQFLDVSLDNKPIDHRRWIGRFKPNYPFVHDVGGKVWNVLKQENAIPQVAIVACDGSLVDSHIGTWSTAQVKEAIRAAIAKAEDTVCN